MVGFREPSPARLAARMGLALALGFSVAAPAWADAKFDEVLAAVVGVHSLVPPDARTADSLGTERAGNGVVIDSEGAVLTIGYLIMEARTVSIIDAEGKEIPAKVVAYDWDSGFGLLRALAPLGVKPIRLGSAKSLKRKDPVLVAGHGGLEAAKAAFVMSRREFSGYWEYLLEDAIFTAPIYPNFGGAALIGADGRLLGIGSLAVNDAPGEGTILPGNMFVPIDVLRPVMADLLERGRPSGPQKPWLGIYTNEEQGRLFVTRVASGGPAEKAGIQPGDIILKVKDQRVTGQADLYRKIWAQGEAGVDVPLTILAGSAIREMTVHSINRYNWLKLDRTQ